MLAFDFLDIRHELIRRDPLSGRKSASRHTRYFALSPAFITLLVQRPGWALGYGLALVEDHSTIT
jgi:hypothetical protein